MLFEAWQQSSLTGCAPAALVAAWPSFALYVESMALHSHACGEARCRGGWAGGRSVCVRRGQKARFSGNFLYTYKR